MLRQPFSFVSFYSALRIDAEPSLNLLFSKTPSGPFQTTVEEPYISLLKSSYVYGPMSKAARLSGIPSDTLWMETFVDSMLSAHLKSTGRTIFTPFYRAFSRIPGAAVKLD